MKKIMIILFALISIFSVKNVFAQNQYKLTLEKQNNIFISRKGTNLNDSQNFYLYKFNGMYAYCIEPGKHITTYDYLGVDNVVDLKISDEIKEKLELIGYYGRDYPGHDNIRYSMATQALIWELTGASSVTFWTKLNAGGEEIDVEEERNEIMDLVNKHKLFPNISKSITADLGKEVVLNDTNNLLSNYEVESKRNGNDVKIIDNTIHIVPNIVGEETITLKLKKYDNEKTIIFVGKESNSQIMGRLRLSTEKEFDINLKVKGIRLVINKIDEEGNKINIKGIRFKIKSLDDDSYLCENDICEYTTNEKGVLITKEFKNGEYEIEEVQNQEIPGYVINTNKIKIVINEDTEYKKGNDYNYVDVNFINNRVKGKLEFTKEDLTTSEGIPNTIIEIYDESDKLLFTETTDEDGKVIIDNLLYGKYYIVEKEANEKYLITNEKVYFEIKENGEIVKAKMTNEKKTVKVPKTDTKEELIVHGLFGLGILIGLGRFIYERKETS